MHALGGSHTFFSLLLTEGFRFSLPLEAAWQPTGAPAGGELTPGAEPETEHSKVEDQKKDIDKPKPRAYIDLNEVLDTLNQEERALAMLLQDGPKHIDELADRAQTGAGRALAMLTMLEVKGIIQRLSSKVYALKETEN